MLLKVVETRGDLEGYLEGSQMSESLGTKCSCGDQNDNKHKKL